MTKYNQDNELIKIYTKALDSDYVGAVYESPNSYMKEIINSNDYFDYADNYTMEKVIHNAKELFEFEQYFLYGKHCNNQRTIFENYDLSTYIIAFCYLLAWQEVKDLATDLPNVQQTMREYISDITLELNYNPVNLKL